MFFSFPNIRILLETLAVINRPFGDRVPPIKMAILGWFTHWVSHFRLLWINHCPRCLLLEIRIDGLFGLLKKNGSEKIIVSVQKMSICCVRTKEWDQKFRDCTQYTVVLKTNDFMTNNYSLDKQPMVCHQLIPWAVCLTIS